MSKQKPNGGLTIERRSLKELRDADYNPRQRLTPEDPEWKRIRRSLEKHGYCDPIIVNRDGTIIGGHQRRNVMLEMGYTEADCVVVDLDRQQERTLNVALNKITGSWDTDKLSELLVDLNGLGGMEAMTATGFDREELGLLVDLGALGYETEDESLDLEDGGSGACREDAEEKLCHCPKCGFEFYAEAEA